MSFYYKKSHYVFYLIMLIVGLLMLGQDIYIALQRGRIRIGPCFFGMIGLIYLGYAGISAQYRQSGKVLVVDENKISVTAGNYQKAIYWAHVKKVKTTIHYQGVLGTGFATIISYIFSQPLFEIEIKDEQSSIIIASTIEKFPELVGYIKAKTGDIFDTTKIPLSFKTLSK